MKERRQMNGGTVERNGIIATKEWDKKITR